MSQEGPNKIPETADARYFSPEELEQAQEAVQKPEVEASAQESGPELHEQIEAEETRLGSNLQEHEAILQATDAKIDASGSESPSRRLLIEAEINEAYQNARKRINEVSVFLTGIMGAGIGFGAAIENLSENSGNVGQWVETGGLAFGLAAAGVFAIGHSLNQLKRQDRKIKEGLT